LSLTSDTTNRFVFTGVNQYLCPQAYWLQAENTKKEFIETILCLFGDFSAVPKQPARTDLAQHKPLANSGQAMSPAIQRPRLLASSSG
jgi:hypothetical protein